MWANRVLNRVERCDFVVFENDFALGVDDKADVKKAVGYFFVAGFGLSHYIDAVRSGYFFCDHVGFGAGNVDRALAGKVHVVGVHNFIVKALQSALRQCDEFYRQIQRRQP